MQSEKTGNYSSPSCGHSRNFEAGSPEHEPGTSPRSNEPALHRRRPKLYLSTA
jgi:hypothetical protein